LRATEVRILPCPPEKGFKAVVAQLVERVLGKDEVTSSILVNGSSSKKVVGCGRWVIGKAFPHPTAYNQRVSDGEGKI